MSGDGVDDVSIPMVFVFYNDAKDILEALKSRPKMEASLLDSSGKYLAQYSLPPKGRCNYGVDIFQTRL